MVPNKEMFKVVRMPSINIVPYLTITVSADVGNINFNR